MSRIRFQSKANGLMVLRGKWLKAIMIMLLMFLLVLGFNEIDGAYRAAFGVPQFLDDGSLNLAPASFIIEAVFTLLILLFLPPLYTGQTEWYWGLSATGGKGIGEVFGWFGSFRLYLKSVLLSFNIFVRGLLWSILTCFIPLGLTALACYYFPPNFNADTLDYNTIIFCFITAFAGLLMVGSLFLLAFIMMRYFLVSYLLVEDNSRSIREIVKTSLRYSKGQRWDMLVFFMSFALWFLSLFLWFPALFVLPYFNASASIYAKQIIFTRRAKEKADVQPVVEKQS